MSPNQQRMNKRKLIWGIVCLAAPTTLIILTLIMFAVVNFIMSANAPTSGSGFGTPSPVATIINIILYGIGGLGVITLVPGFVIGIILLVTRK